MELLLLYMPSCNWYTRRKDADINERAQVAEKFRARVDEHVDAFPSVLEIPSKDHPYDPEKDSVLKRVRKLFGE